MPLIAPLVFQELFVIPRPFSNWPAARVLLLACLGLSVQAFAAPPPNPVAPAVAANADADAAPPAYRSAFEGYQRYTEEKPVNWKEANDSVARIGGWRAYAKEASPSSPPAASTESDSGSAPAKP